MFHSQNILMVDDDLDILELLQRQLHSMNFHTYKAVSVEQALSILKDTTIHLLITDIQMPQVNGLQLIKYVAEHYPHISRLVITGYPSVEGAKEVIKSGATDYLTKPFTKKELCNAVNKSLEKTTIDTQQKINVTGINKIFPDMIGESREFLKVADIISRVKDNKATVLISGESGTGKELVARAIHYSGKFSKNPFIPVNCGAIPESLLESELFGYKKGAFTGANDNRNGFFQASNGGTIFLDEIGTASQAVQIRLLRVLQEKEITKVGSSKAEKIDSRIIAATNLDLSECVANSSFREDLYYRLSVVEIYVPPLRERKSDIPLLFEKFLKKYGIEYKDRILKVNPEVFHVLQRYHWPGNIRELENIVQRAVIMCNGVIEVSHLPDYLKFQIDFPETTFVSLKEMEKKYILKVLAASDNNKSKAASILQIDRKTLREKLK